MLYNKGTPSRNIVQQLQPNLEKISANTATLDDLKKIINSLNVERHHLSDEYLLNSQHTWDVIERCTNSTIMKALC